MGIAIADYVKRIASGSYDDTVQVWQAKNFCHVSIAALIIVLVVRAFTSRIPQNSAQRNALDSLPRLPRAWAPSDAHQLHLYM